MQLRLQGQRTGQRRRRARLGAARDQHRRQLRQRFALAAERAQDPRALFARAQPFGIHRLLVSGQPRQRQVDRIQRRGRLPAGQRQPRLHGQVRPGLAVIAAVQRFAQRQRALVGLFGLGQAAAFEQHQGQVEIGARVLVHSGEAGGFEDRDRAAQVLLGGLEAAQADVQRAALQMAASGHRGLRAEQLLVDRQRPVQRGRRLLEAFLIHQRHAQRGQRDRFASAGAGMAGLDDAQGLADTRLGRGIVADRAVGAGQRFERIDQLDLRRQPGRVPARDRRLQRRARLGEALDRGQRQPRQERRFAGLQRIGAEHALAARRGQPRHGDGLVVTAVEEQHIRGRHRAARGHRIVAVAQRRQQRAQRAFGLGQAVVAPHRLDPHQPRFQQGARIGVGGVQRQGLVRQPLRQRQVAGGIADLGQHQQQFGAGGVRQRLAAHPRQRRLDQIVHARPAIERPGRAGQIENADHEIAYLVGALRLQPGDAGLLARGPRLPQRDPERGHDRHAERRAGQHRDAVALDELAQQVRARGRMRQHRTALQVTFQIGGQRAGVAIAPFRLGVQRLEHDGVQVAAQAPFAHAFGQVVAACGQRRRPARRIALRTLAQQQFVQQHAQRIHVRRGGHRAAVALLGRGVARGEQAETAGAVVELVLQQLGDAEVQQLERAVGGDQQVGRLDVAMHDQHPMRRIDRLGRGQQQAQARRQVEPPGAGVGGDRRTVDVFHRQVRNPRGGHPAVDQAGDVRMLQARQHPPFALEQAQFQRRIQAAPQQLDRAVLDEIGADPLAQEHRRGTALSEQAQQPERADGLPDQAAGQGAVRHPLRDLVRGRSEAGVQPGRVLADRRVQVAAGRVGVEQALQGGATFVVGHLRGQPGGARIGRHLAGPVEQRAQRIGRRRRARVGRARGIRAAGRGLRPARHAGTPGRSASRD